VIPIVNRLLGYADNVCLEENVERHISDTGILNVFFFLKTANNLRFRHNKRANAQQVLRSADISWLISVTHQQMHIRSLK